jgi:hypothetical protein
MPALNVAQDLHTTEGKKKHCVLNDCVIAKHQEVEVLVCIARASANVVCANVVLVCCISM